MNAADAPPGAGIGMQAQAARPAGRWRRLWRLLWPLPWTDPRAALYDPWHGRNPVFLHELYAMRFQVERRPGRRVARVIQWIGLALATPVIIYVVGRLAVEIARQPEPRETVVAVAVVIHLSAALVQHLHLPFIAGLTAVSPAATSIVRERDRGTWDLLRTTALDARRIVLGKILAAAEMFPLVAVSLIGLTALRSASLAVLMVLAPVWYIGSTPSTGPILWLAMLTANLPAPPVILVGAACGVAVSAWIRWNAAATGLANALYVALTILPSIIAIIPLLVFSIIGIPAVALSFDDAVVLAALLPLVMALVYGLLAAGLLRLAIAGVRRRE